MNSRPLALFVVLALSCCSPTELPVVPAPAVAPPAVVVGTYDGQLERHWALDGENRRVSVGASAEVALVHEVLDARAVRVSVDSIQFGLEREGGEDWLVFNGWKTPLGGVGSTESIRLSDGTTRLSSLEYAVDSVGCERFSVETSWAPVSPLHAVSQEVQWRLCPAGQLESWSVWSTFPTGTRTIQWSRGS